MNIAAITEGMKVVRTIGDYVVGRSGAVVAIDSVKNRVQVEWEGNPKTWVSVKAIEDASRPHEVVRVPGKWPKVKFL